MIKKLKRKTIIYYFNIFLNALRNAKIKSSTTRRLKIRKYVVRKGERFHPHVTVFQKNVCKHNLL